MEHLIRCPKVSSDNEESGTFAFIRMILDVSSRMNQEVVHNGCRAVQLCCNMSVIVCYCEWSNEMCQRMRTKDKMKQVKRTKETMCRSFGVFRIR